MNNGNRLRRLLRHAVTFKFQTKNAFDDLLLTAIETAITEAESRHGGQIRWVVETELSALQIWDRVSARERAVQLFADLHIWDTEHNNGVLIYILFAEKRVEIVADRGVHRLTSVHQPKIWRQVCQQLESDFKTGQFKSGALAAIAATGQVLAAYFPTADLSDELSNKPLRI
jgi:uncharacterized membrane protein